MRIELTSAFTTLAVSEGTLQNVSRLAQIEVSSTQTENTGIVLNPGDILQFKSDVTLYARAVWKNAEPTEKVFLAHEPFKGKGEGGDNVLTYKGSVETYDDLPSTHNVGDVYNIETADETHGILAGDNVAWNGTSWDRLAGIYAIMQGATSSAAGKAGLAPAPAAGAETKVLFGDGTYKDISQVPLGAILPYSANANTPPPGFLYCEGQAISRTMYPDLFALIGTTYGAGDGSTTFNLPNLIGKYPQGDTTAGTVKAAGLPNITGTGISQFFDTVGRRIVSTYTTSGAISKVGSSSAVSPRIDQGSGNYTVGDYGLSFDASNSNPIYGNSTTVTPPTLTVRWIIKAYDAPTPSSAQIDLSQYASDLAKRLTREQTPAFNRRDVVTVSGTYTAPVTGWYKITVKGGGGGGQGGGRNTSYSYNYGGAGGGEGGTTIAYEKLTAGQAVSVVVGAGGAGGAGGEVGAEGNSGGASSVTVNNQIYSANGGKLGGGRIGGSGGTGTIAGEAGTSTYGVFYHPSTSQEQYTAFGSKGGGYGGRSWYTQPNNNAVANTGGGGGGGGVYNETAYAGGNGASGFVEFEYFDPTLM